MALLEVVFSGSMFERSDFCRSLVEDWGLRVASEVQRALFGMQVEKTSLNISLSTRQP